MIRPTRFSIVSRFTDVGRETAWQVGKLEPRHRARFLFHSADFDISPVAPATVPSMSTIFQTRMPRMPTNKFVPVRRLLIAVGCLTAISLSPLGGEVPAASPVSSPIAAPQALPQAADASPTPHPTPLRKLGCKLCHKPPMRRRLRHRGSYRNSHARKAQPNWRTRRPDAQHE